MSRLTVFLLWVLIWTCGVPLVVCAFASYVPTDIFSFASWKSAIAANLRFVEILAAIGFVIGLGVGVYQLVKGGKSPFG
jgi:hypothetical protein